MTNIKKGRYVSKKGLYVVVLSTATLQGASGDMTIVNYSVEKRPHELLASYSKKFLAEFRYVSSGGRVVLPQLLGPHITIEKEFDTTPMLHLSIEDGFIGLEGKLENALLAAMYEAFGDGLESFPWVKEYCDENYGIRIYMMMGENNHLRWSVEPINGQFDEKTQQQVKDACNAAYVSCREPFKVELLPAVSNSGDMMVLSASGNLAEESSKLQAIIADKINAGEVDFDLTEGERGLKLHIDTDGSIALNFNVTYADSTALHFISTYVHIAMSYRNAYVEEMNRQMQEATQDPLPGMDDEIADDENYALPAGDEGDPTYSHDGSIHDFVPYGDIEISNRTYIPSIAVEEYREKVRVFCKYDDQFDIDALDPEFSEMMSDLIDASDSLSDVIGDIEDLCVQEFKEFFSLFGDDHTRIGCANPQVESLVKYITERRVETKLVNFIKEEVEDTEQSSDLTEPVALEDFDESVFDAQLDELMSKRDTDN